MRGNLESRLEKLEALAHPKQPPVIRVGLWDQANPDIIELGGGRTMTRQEWEALPGRRIHVSPPQAEEEGEEWEE